MLVNIYFYLGVGAIAKISYQTFFRLDQDLWPTMILFHADFQVTEQYNQTNVPV